MKVTLLIWAFKFIMCATALGIGIWYIDSSIGGASLSYINTDNFMSAIGASDENIANVNGCFLCEYVRDLFGVIGRATEQFWTLTIDHMWILMALGFGVFLVVYTGQYLLDALKSTSKLDASEKKLELHGWFDKVWHQGLRVIIAGTLIGALGMGGTSTLRTITNITITPVMFVGAQLASTATGAITGAACETELAENTSDTDILNPVMQPFMCVMGNLNTVILAGAAGGFALMNYAWLGLGGGIFTWLAGISLVILFLIIGFNLFFQVLSIIFKLIFVIIFVPFFIAATAFQPVWNTMQNLSGKAFEMVVKSAVQIIAISLKIAIMFAIVSFAADSYFPGPIDGFSTILPPLLGHTEQNTDTQSMSVINVFKECETVSLKDGQIDKDLFLPCFNQKKEQIESRYPGAFDFMSAGWDFIMMMIGIFLLYIYVLEPKINAMLGIKSMFGNDKTEEFNFGGWVKDFGKATWSIPEKLFEAVVKEKSK